jgi:phosphoglycolate phosphatase
MNKDLLIFDLDGTLIDSGGDIAWAANKTLVALGYQEMTTAAIKERIGWGVKVLLERLMPEEGPERIEEARIIFLDFYGSHMVEETYPYPEVEETLEHFSTLGKKMAVVTNKPEGLADGILKELKLRDIFHMVVGGDTLKNRKPHPGPLNKVLSALGAAAAESIFVGDSTIDAETGRTAGVFTVGVSYGFGGGRSGEGGLGARAELLDAGFDLIIDRFGELKGIVE